MKNDAEPSFAEPESIRPAEFYDIETLELPRKEGYKNFLQLCPSLLIEFSEQLFVLIHAYLFYAVYAKFLPL